MQKITKKFWGRIQRNTILRRAKTSKHQCCERATTYKIINNNKVKINEKDLKKNCAVKR